MKRLLLILPMLITAHAGAQLANQPPAPRWLGLETAASNTTLEVGTEFELQGNLLKAILLVAADAETEVLVNAQPGRRVPTGKDSPATSLDLTSSLVTGKNTLRLRTTAPKVAALLELNGDLTQVRWIASNAVTWTSAGGKVLEMGTVDADPATNPFDLKKTFDAYNSWQLAKPGAQSQATDPRDFTLLPGFKAPNPVKIRGSRWLLIRKDASRFPRRRKGCCALIRSQAARRSSRTRCWSVAACSIRMVCFMRTRTTARASID
jgi:hypothetical protein